MIKWHPRVNFIHEEDVQYGQLTFGHLQLAEEEPRGAVTIGPWCGLYITLFFYFIILKPVCSKTSVTGVGS